VPVLGETNLKDALHTMRHRRMDEYSSLLPNEPNERTCIRSGRSVRKSSRSDQVLFGSRFDVREGLKLWFKRRCVSRRRVNKQDTMSSYYAIGKNISNTTSINHSVKVCIQNKGDISNLPSSLQSIVNEMITSFQL